MPSLHLLGQLALLDGQDSRRYRKPFEHGEEGWSVSVHQPHMATLDSDITIAQYHIKQYLERTKNLPTPLDDLPFATYYFSRRKNKKG
jgi:hypothetical protein